MMRIRLPDAHPGFARLRSRFPLRSPACSPLHIKLSNNKMAANRRLQQMTKMVGYVRHRRHPF